MVKIYHAKSKANSKQNFVIPKNIQNTYFTKFGVYNLIISFGWTFLIFTINYSTKDKKKKI